MAKAAMKAPTEAELEEAAADAENSIDLASENRILKAQLAELMARVDRLAADRGSSAEAELEAPIDVDPNVPVFDETQPHGIVTGDSEVAFVQDGHQFGRDRRYIATEKNRGSPRAFNPRLVGVVRKPKLAPLE